MASSPDRQGVGSTGKTRTDHVVETAKQAAAEASRAVQTSTDSVVQTGSNVIRNTVLDSREVASAGARLVAEAAAHAVDASVSDHRHGAAAQGSVPREAAGDVQALSTTYTQLGQGMLRMQHAYFDLLRDAMEQARRRPQQILGCRSIPEFAQVQRELYADGIGFMLNASNRMLQMAGEIARDASRPLQARVRQDTE